MRFVLIGRRSGIVRHNQYAFSVVNPAIPRPLRLMPQCFALVFFMGVIGCGAILSVVYKAHFHFLLLFPAIHASPGSLHKSALCCAILGLDCYISMRLSRCCLRMRLTSKMPTPRSCLRESCLKGKVGTFSEQYKKAGQLMVCTKAVKHKTKALRL